MKKPKLTDEEFDQLLEEAKPDLQAMRRNSPPITPERIKELKNKLEKIHPFLRVLTAKQMESLLLKILEQKSLDVTEISDRLDKANFKLRFFGNLLGKRHWLGSGSEGCAVPEVREAPERARSDCHRMRRPA